MRLVLGYLAVAAALLAATPFARAATAQAGKGTAMPAIRPAASTSVAARPVAPRVDWIIHDDATYTPVVDSVSRHLDAARRALAANDPKTAAAEMRIVAEELRLESASAADEEGSIVKADKALLASDSRLAHDAVQRLDASAAKADAAATAIGNGDLKTTADLDRTIDKATRADMERRWLVADVATWYPVSDEAQRHFTDSAAAFAKKDFTAAAADIRKATGYLRLETERATGGAKRELADSVDQLDRLAADVEKGTLKDAHAMTGEFARAQHALALEHRSRAAESWARARYESAGYELKAAARGLEGAASWAGAEAKAGAAATVRDAEALSDKLASGASWTRDEVVKGFRSFDRGVDAMGTKVGNHAKTSPFDVRA